MSDLPGSPSGPASRAAREGLPRVRRTSLGASRDQQRKLTEPRKAEAPCAFSVPPRHAAHNDCDGAAAAGGPPPPPPPPRPGGGGGAAGGAPRRGSASPPP